MKARVGDRLVPEGDLHRAGVIIDVPNPDGSPPYVVKWLNSGHIALFFPGSYTKVIRESALMDASETANRTPRRP